MRVGPYDRMLRVLRRWILLESTEGLFPGYRTSGRSFSIFSISFQVRGEGSNHKRLCAAGRLGENVLL